MGQHDAGAACASITPAFWRAFAGDLNLQLASADRSIPSDDCRAGLRALFPLFGKTPVIRSGVSVSDVVVHGNTATARQTGPVPETLRFEKQGGAWRLDCCIGRQLEEQAQATYRIPSPSMTPTLHVGQFVVSDNAALRAHPPGLGAIVVFHPPAGADSPDPRCGVPSEGVNFPQPCGRPTPGESGQTFIKRIVGLPGDTIAIVNGNVIRNGKPEPRTYRVEACNAEPACNFPKPVTIPAGEYFVLGDNLPDSDDSRFWGPVKRSWLIGLVRVGGSSGSG
jgi:signal peptidase I